MYWITAMPFLSCFISVVKEKSGELAASLPPDHPILVSACYKSQEGYRFASTALRPFHVILVILNYLSKGHGWIDCMPSVPNMVLILSVAAGVGAFLVVALLRILFGIALAPLLVVFYGVIFVIARFVPDNFLAVAFDSGGVTTGPMTVPFIMALGVGISAIRNDKHAENDSFGLVALCSIGLFLRYCSWDWYILPRDTVLCPSAFF